MFHDPRWGHDSRDHRETTGVTVATSTALRQVVARVQAVHPTTTPMIICGIVTTIHKGSTVIATRAIATMASTRATCSVGTSSYHEGLAEKWKG
jgi:hypothetical protein